jgi:transcriptional antiterminator NusG
VAIRDRPSPISNAEVTKIMDQMQAGVDKPKPKTLFEVGEMVRVKEGRLPTLTATLRK